MGITINRPIPKIENGSIDEDKLDISVRNKLSGYILLQSITTTTSYIDVTIPEGVQNIKIEKTTTNTDYIYWRANNISSSNYDTVQVDGHNDNVAHFTNQGDGILIRQGRGISIFDISKYISFNTVHEYSSDPSFLAGYLSEAVNNNISSISIKGSEGDSNIDIYIKY